MMELENIFDPENSRNFRREVTLKKFQSAAEVIKNSLLQQKIVEEEVEDSVTQQPVESESGNDNSPPNPAEFRNMILGCY